MRIVKATDVINEVIEKEMDYARRVNPIMALGMARIKELLNSNETLENLEIVVEEK